jgi:hypothetical protein
LRIQRPHLPLALQWLGKDHVRARRRARTWFRCGGIVRAVSVFSVLGITSAIAAVGAGLCGGRGGRGDRLSVRHEDDAVDHLLQLGEDVTGDQDGDAGGCEVAQEDSQVGP